MTFGPASDKPPSSEDGEARTSKLSSLRARLPSVVLLALLAALFTGYFLRIHDKPTILMNYIPFASARFAGEGFLFHRFTPPFPDLWSNYSATEHTVWYTHYPPLPFYIGGLLWRLGVSTKAALCVFFNIVALGYLLLFYRVFSLLLNRWIACISTLVMACHPMFIEQVLENYLNLSLFFQTAAFLFLILALESPAKRRRRLLLVCAWACLFGDAYSSFDQTLASGFIVFAYTLWRLGPKQWKRVAVIVGVLATASISAFALHLGTNAWFFGSIDAAFRDLCVDALQDKSTREIPFQDKISLREYPIWLAREVWDYYAMSLIGVAGVGGSLAWALAKGRKTLLTRRFFVVAAILCVANLSYWAAFSRLNYLQFHLANGAQWLPTYSILLGGAVYFMATEIRRYWTFSGIGKSLVLIPELLGLLCLFQIYVHVMRIVEPTTPSPGSVFTQEVCSDVTVRLMGDLADKIPEGAVLAFTDRSALGRYLVLTPRTAFGLRELPFSVYYFKASDKNALFKLESRALSKDIYILRTYFKSVSAEERRENIIPALIEAEIPREKWEEIIADLSPIDTRPNWELVESGENYDVHRIHTPKQDDLFPDRAALPTRLAISGARIRDGHELQIVGWIFTPERVNRIEIRLDGEVLGDAIYPAPGKELAEKSFEGMRRWFGMQDYPLPEEELKADYPEYKDDMPRFIFLRKNTRPSPTSHTVSVHAYSGNDLVIEASYNLDYVQGRHKIREYFPVEKPSPSRL